jgi:steroid delta-isomerase-like uncharacterized protein
MKHLLALLAISSVLLSSCMKKEGGTSDAMMRSDSMKNANITIYRTTTDLMNSGKMDDLTKYIADNYTEHQMMPGQKPGLAGLKEMMTNMHSAFPDMKFTINKVIADSNTVWAQFTMTGTNSGAFMGMPATGKKVNVDGVDIIRFENGKAVEHWGYMEDMKWMQQMGMMPAPGAPPAEGTMPGKEMKKGK